MSKAELEYLGIKIPKKLKKELNKAIERGDYVSQSDLTRAAIKKLLERKEDE